MAHVHHFEYGWLTPGIAYCVSVLGSFLGLLCAARAREYDGSRRRFGWLALSATALGGTGIWLMHFMAMIGFSVVGSDIRYEVKLTALSALLAIVVVFLGLLILGVGPAAWNRVLLGGIVTGLGVAGMHFIGMAAMRVDGSVGYSPLPVLASIVIAVTAATAALWFTIVARSTPVVLGAAMIMGVAVTGMHYVGMAAVRVTLGPALTALHGVDVTTALPPIAAIAGVAMAILIYLTLSKPQDNPLPLAPAPREPDSTSPPPPRPGPGSRPMYYQPTVDE
jgi:NO-binding membrane sensor protein with MHYT domain